MRWMVCLMLMFCMQKKKKQSAKDLIESSKQTTRLESKQMKGALPDGIFDNKEMIYVPVGTLSVQGTSINGGTKGKAVAMDNSGPDTVAVQADLLVSDSFSVLGKVALDAHIAKENAASTMPVNVEPHRATNHGFPSHISTRFTACDNIDKPPNNCKLPCSAPPPFRNDKTKNQHAATFPMKQGMAGSRIQDLHKATFAQEVKSMLFSDSVVKEMTTTSILDDESVDMHPALDISVDPSKFGPKVGRAMGFIIPIVGQPNGNKKIEFMSHLLDELHVAAANKGIITDPDFSFAGEDFPPPNSSFNVATHPYQPLNFGQPSFNNSLTHKQKESIEPNVPTMETAAITKSTPTLSKSQKKRLKKTKAGFLKNSEPPSHPYCTRQKATCS